MKRNALGRGLSSLIPEPPAASAAASGTRELEVARVDPSSRQPRRKFDEDELAELAASLRTHGVIQPIVVSQEGERFRLIAGERRWRAAMKAGLKTIPAVVRHVTEKERLELGIIENIQRQDLNPMEEARAYDLLTRESSLSREDLAQRVGKSRPHVSNMLRLLTLTEEIQTLVEAGRLSMGHARALTALPGGREQIRAARQIQERDLPVRAAERLVARMLESAREARGEGAAGAAPPAPRRDPNVRAAEERLKRALGTAVRIVGGPERGRIEIDFVSARELQRIFEALEASGRPQPTGTAGVRDFVLPGRTPPPPEPAG